MTKLYVCEISDLIKEVKEDSKALENYFDKLGKLRIEHILRNHKAEDRARALGASYLLLFALEKEGISLNKLPDFSYTKTGKPFFREYPEIFFNISHAKNIITCAISKETVGTDIEHMRIIQDSTINRVFTENEKNIVGQDAEGYVRLWTMKEAYAKLMGTGLSDIWEGIEVLNKDGNIFVQKLNQDIRNATNYVIIDDGKLSDFENYPYYYSVCSKTKHSVEKIFTKWDNHSIVYC